ncbi:histidine kinase dimerization/phospho-acceptor domain-containing protein [Paracoccus sp. CPCC 101403]|uniref:histidine kinase n=1 Tax=Paracoccus broussonetiae TaxID=3075834 RepID=A0ABU3E9Q3_9RHOB|nr:histidine kinase dimerization/phospho-acceptor domain-containing protein [Paracoccus sp. CPCC 101403]MDT1060954.1 histidine kinase dimerization/phospho-acceptor domain-containing protein [Paracoccus sp. CPCC 101403]
MRRSSLLRDLVNGFGAGIVLIWCVALLVGWMVLREELDEIYDAMLARVADHVLALSGRAENGARSADLLIQFTAPDGTIEMSPEGADRAAFSLALAEGYTEVGDMRVLTLKNSDGSVLRVADPLKERREAARETLVGMLLPSIILLPLAFLATRVFIRRRLAPVRALSAEVEGRSASDLRPLTVQDIPDELEPVLIAVNRLMTRLSEALEAERSFSSNAAHELRTPIAAAYAQTQLLIDEAENPAMRARSEAIARSMQRLSRLAAKLLELARAEVVRDEQEELSDLAPVLRLVAQDSGSGHIYRIPNRPVLVRMDVDVFAPLARNLIENAELHGQTPIAVRLTDDLFEVTNRGRVVPPDRLARLTRRFERAGSREVGSGLGLAIVDTLAKNAGARLELLSPEPGREDGFVARVHFPLREA